MQDIPELLEDTREQITTVLDLYNGSVESGLLSPKLGPRIKNVIENQRSVLDYLAYQIHGKYGTPTTAKVYYPFSKKPTYFKGDIDGRMPGVRANRPDIGQAIRKYQPFNREWMVWLEGLRNERGHRTLSKHERKDVPVTEIKLSPGPTVHIQNVLIVGPNNEPIPPTAYGVMFGQPNAPTKSGTAIEWHFVDPDMRVTIVLQVIQQGVESVVNEIGQLADL